MWKNHVYCLFLYVGGAELYHNLTAKVKASVRPLIASGPQFHLRIRYTDPVPTRFLPGSDPVPTRGVCRHTVRQLRTQLKTRASCLGSTKLCLSDLKE